MSDGRSTSKKKTSSGFHFLAGLGSGVSSAFILQPADLLKTRVQQQTRTRSLRLALSEVLQGPNPLRQLWRGTTPSVIRTGAGSALYFGMLNQMRQYALQMQTLAGGNSTGPSPPPVKLTNLANLATGAFARVAAGFVVNPVTVLKVRYESTQYAYTSLAHAATDIARREGVRGFFAGFGATAIRDAPYAGLYVLVYEQAKTRLRDAISPVSTSIVSIEEQSKLSAVAGLPSMTSTAGVNFASGVVAATTATTLTNPFDAIKTRLQLAPGRYRHMLQAAQMMLREEGLRSMFTGLGLRIGRKAISSALTWTVYEEMLRRADRALLLQQEQKQL